MPPSSAAGTGERIRRLLPPPFACRLSEDGGTTTTVHVAGELDIATVADLEQALNASLVRSPLVVLDLRELTFIDSGGVRTVVSCSERARASGRRVAVLQGPRDVERVFALAGSQNDVEPIDFDSLEPSVKALLRPVEIAP